VQDTSAGRSGRLVRLLFLSDTHLGFDEPQRPRSRRPRRGPDFFASFDRVLQAARAERPDAFIHGGDLYYRRRVPDALIDRVMAPLVSLAESGIPVLLVAGNHEWSSLPRTLFTLHDRIHIFNEPSTVSFAFDGVRVAIGGFPFVRQGVRQRFPSLVAETGLMSEPADVRLLCMHQMVEGARVGPSGYQFRDGDDVVRASDLPAGVTAFLCGHVHRHQVLRTDLSGKPLPAPVLYAGSTERTSFAEMSETKGFVSLLAGPAQGPEGALRSIEFRALPARPMYARTLDPGPLPQALARLRSSLADVDANGVLRVRLPADQAGDSARIVAAVKAIVPPTMVLSFGLPSGLESAFDPRRS
jgi:DNA repair protein SbcD/Mre11